MFILCWLYSMPCPPPVNTEKLGAGVVSVQAETSVPGLKKVSFSKDRIQIHVLAYSARAMGFELSGPWTT